MSLKILISLKPTWNSQWSLISRNVKREHPLPILWPYFRSFSLKKGFLRNSSKPRHGNLVLITSTVQFELSKLNFNSDDIWTYFLHVLRDCRQITFVMLNVFCPLSKKKKKNLFLTNHMKMDRICTNQTFLH